MSWFRSGLVSGIAGKGRATRMPKEMLTTLAT